MINLGILASGRGSNFEAIADAIDDLRCDAKITVLISNNPDAPALAKAKKRGIKTEVIERKKFKNRKDMDSRIVKILEKNEVDLVVLAGYMLLLKGDEIFEKYENKIINIHPSLLPAFPGINAQKQAFDHGCKISGATVHFVNRELDAGPIIEQKAVDISECKTADEVAEKILVLEHEIYPKVINMFSKGKFLIEGRRVIYRD